MKSIRKRSAAILLSQAYAESPEYLVGDIMQMRGSHKGLSKMMIPMILKMKAKHIETLLNDQIGEKYYHVKTT